MNLLILICVVLCALLNVASASGESAKIVVKETALREQCKFLSPATIKLQYNDSVDILSRESDWFKVAFGKARGCLHKSALEARTYSLSGVSGTRGGVASQEEVSLAGKGFTPEVEASYKKQHRDFNYQAVDTVEKYRVSDETLRKFVRDGGLRQP
jgi:hypothetical protein